jgi:hypothetical protein
MPPPANAERYKNHRFPGEIISHGVWLYYRFPLSYLDVQAILLEQRPGYWVFGNNGTENRLQASALLLAWITWLPQRPQFATGHGCR